MRDERRDGRMAMKMVVALNEVDVGMVKRVVGV